MKIKKSDYAKWVHFRHFDHMTRKLYRRNPVTREIEEIEGLSREVEAHAVHQDTLEKPLRHPVTGRIHDSKTTYLQDCAKTGTRVVGNDWVGLEQCKPQDRITDAMIMDRIHKGEAILRDPAKRRERQNLNMKMAETSKRFIERGSIPVARVPDEKR